MGWAIFGGIIFVLILIGLLKEALGIHDEDRYGVSDEWCDRHLGRVKVGGESFTGRFMNAIEGIDTYLIMTRNDDLTPPWQIIRTIQCPDCKCIVLPHSGCCCQLSNSKTPKQQPIFQKSSPGYLAREYFAGYPKKKGAAA